MSQVRSRVSLLTPPEGVPQLALAPEPMRLETKPPPGYVYGTGLPASSNGSTPTMRTPSVCLDQGLQRIAHADIRHRGAGRMVLHHQLVGDLFTALDGGRGTGLTTLLTMPTSTLSADTVTVAEVVADALSRPITPAEALL